jgi:hypothetical protein
VERHPVSNLDLLWTNILRSENKMFTNIEELGFQTRPCVERVVSFPEILPLGAKKSSTRKILVQKKRH